MAVADLIEKLAEQRRHWVEVAPGAKVRLIRPLETDFGRFRLGVTVEHLCEYVDGWAGFSEALILGPRQGSPEVMVDFAPTLWAQLIRDRTRWVPPLAKALAKLISEHLEAQDAASGN